MKQTVLLVLVIIGVTAFAQEGEEDEWVTRSYVLGRVPVFESPAASNSSGGGFGNDPFGGDPFGNPGRPSPMPGVEESNLPWARKTANPDFLAAYVNQHLGVTFPEGSWVRYQRAGHILHMRNTPINHAWLRAGLVQFDFIPTQIQIGLQMVSFPEELIAEQEREQGGDLPDEVFHRLRKQGAATVIASQSIKTINGVNAIIECVDEIIYPTEIDVDENQVEVAKSSPPPTPGPVKLVYGGFETREVGAILNITPTVHSDNRTINLIVLPEKVAFKGDAEWLPEDARPAAPVFHSVNMTTSLVLNSGSTVVAGHTTDVVPGKRIVIFFTATLVDGDGHEFRIPTDPPTPVEAEGKE